MTESKYRHNTLFRGILNDDLLEQLEDDDLSFEEFDTRVYNMQPDLNRIEPNREVRVETEYLGNNGEVEIIFSCRTTWMDRESDLIDYLDKVQETLENDLEILISEKEFLGYSRDQ